MKNAVLLMVATSLSAMPARAADWSDVRAGTFVGARLTIGGKDGRRPTAGLTIAPTQNRISESGMPTMRVGEGLAISFSPGANKPALSLAGIRADRALGLTKSGDANAEHKLGVSTGGWIAIGLGAAAVIGGAVIWNTLEEADENSD